MSLYAFDLPHVFTPDADRRDNAEALRILLESLIALNRAHLRHHAERPLYRSGVVYGRTREWLTIPALYRRGYGDCKSLSAALIAEYREAGIAASPSFRWQYRDAPEGGDQKDRFFHILVQTDVGYEDPSKILGMKTRD